MKRTLLVPPHRTLLLHCAARKHVRTARDTMIIVARKLNVNEIDIYMHLYKHVSSMPILFFFVSLRQAADLSTSFVVVVAG